MAYINIIRKVKAGHPTSFDPMQKPHDEDARVKALRRFEIMDSPSEEIFSAYTELAALTFRTPIALMSFVGSDTTFYKEAYGVKRTGQLVPRKNSPCSIAIMSKDISMFRYALTDPCVLADEKNLAEVGYKFYAGAPLTTREGYNIGMLAVVDREPRSYKNKELKQLAQLAMEVMNEVEFRFEARNDISLPILNERLIDLHRRVEAIKNSL